MRFISLLLVAGALAFAGCGDDDDGDTGGSAPPPPAATATTPAEQGGTVEIRMKDFQFAPREATVKVGQKVKWVNDDTAEHDAVANDGQFKSDQFGKGGTYEYTADKPGTIEYVCTLHSNMTATLTVTE